MQRFQGADLRKCSDGPIDFSTTSAIIEDMSTRYADQVPFSELMRKQSEVADKAAHGKGVLLRRRNEEDLVLMSAAHAESTANGFSVASRMFVSLMKHDAGARELLMVLPDVFPWVRYLPEEDVREFLVDLVQTIDACDDLENLAPLETAVAAWRSTAEVYADPKLRAALTEGELDDLGQVEVC
ncbi:MULTISPECIES: hypothetical protein [Streptomyces]|uniref:Prevent-host-death family protein n=2 Tax=Streptomyces TaxID=1883 RepID=A0ABW6YMJ3_9ACTN|nr:MULTISPECIES: hypothetical protein [Streptomyces]